MTIASGSYSTTVSTVIYDPQAPPVNGGSTPAKLVFLQPTSPGTGTINAAVSPQPIVAVEDTNGNIVYSDASSVTLTASGPGSLSSNCSGVENGGIVSFSGCSFSAQGTYSLTATDSNHSVLQATGASYSITPSASGQGGLHHVTRHRHRVRQRHAGPDHHSRAGRLRQSRSRCAHRQPHLEFWDGDLRADVRWGLRHLGVHSCRTIDRLLLLRGHHGRLADDLGRCERPPDRDSDRNDQSGPREQVGRHDRAAVLGFSRHCIHCGRHGRGSVGQHDYHPVHWE